MKSIADSLVSQKSSFTRPIVHGEYVPNKSERPDCPTCRGAGFLVADVGYKDQRFGKPIPCPTCSDGQLRKRLSEFSQLNGTLRDKRLEQYEAPPGDQNALNIAAGYCKNPRGFLTFYGSYGVGKTHLLAGLVNACCENGIAAVYYTFPDLLQTLRRSYENDAFDRTFERLCNVTVLALDEVDKIRHTEWALEQVYRLIDERYRNAHLRGTVFALNTYPKSDGDNSLGYLYSRMHAGLVIEVRCADYRTISHDAMPAV